MDDGSCESSRHHKLQCNGQCIRNRIKRKGMWYWIFGIMINNDNICTYQSIKLGLKNGKYSKICQSKIDVLLQFEPILIMKVADPLN